MRFNGVDPRTLHRAISVCKEIPPGGPPRSVHTVRGNKSPCLCGVTEEEGVYLVRMNIAGRGHDEAWAVREILAGWAYSSGEKLARIEPTHRPGVFYEGIVSRISEPEFKAGFATIDIEFAVPHCYALSTRKSSASGNGAATMMICGSGTARPTISQTIAADADGLIWTMDGAGILGIRGSLSAGQTVIADYADGWLTIDGEHAEERILYTQTDWMPGFTPGRHTIASSDEGIIDVGWREEWA